MKRQWYEINAKHEVPEIFIYDVIGQDFWGDGVSAKTFIEDLRDIKADTIKVRINSTRPRKAASRKSSRDIK